MIPGDRRVRRHEETRETIVTLAIEIMGVDGVAGLSLGELARRLGVRTPSLYTYFASKNSLYDELFRRGWSDAHADFAAALGTLGEVTPESDVVVRGSVLSETFVRWAMAHPELAELMMFRPVPKYVPSAEAFAPSREFFGQVIGEVDAWARQGLLAPDVDAGEVVESFLSVVTGVVARQLANEPGVPFESGRASRHLGVLITRVVNPYPPLDA